jgi:uncharacterized protein (UPF0335 family)
MSDTSIPGGRIRSFVERIEHLDTELQELNESKKEVFAEAKAEGFDVKILKEIIKLRKQDQDERDERETLLDMYMRAMETAGPELAAKAAWLDRNAGFAKYFSPNRWSGQPGHPSPSSSTVLPFCMPAVVAFAEKNAVLACEPACRRASNKPAVAGNPDTLSAQIKAQPDPQNFLDHV